MTSLPPAPIRIDVFFDTICPWCFIGKRRLENALRLRPSVGATVRWAPFLLNPGMPAHGMDRRVYLAEKFGGERRAQRIYRAIAEAGATAGIEFDFDAITRTPPSVPSHRLIRYAAAHGRADAAVEAVFEAFFLRGADIGRRDVLLDLGADVGLEVSSLEAFLDSSVDVGAVHDGNIHAHQMGIEGVPAFMFNGRNLLSGAHDERVMTRMIDLAVTDAERYGSDGETPLSTIDDPLIPVVERH